MKPALLVIDVQNAYFPPGSSEAQSLAGALDTLNAAIDLFRQKGLPVVCVQQLDDEQKIVPGDAAFEVPAGLHILPSDLHIHKTFSSSFTKTALEAELDRLDVDTVIVSGFCAEYCVLSTYRGARELGLTPIMLRGALVSGVPENIRFVENISEVISFGALKAAL
jgi:nicotinamidase-related amidase